MQALLLSAKILTLFIASVCAIADTQNRMRNRNNEIGLLKHKQESYEKEQIELTRGKILTYIEEQNLLLCKYCENCKYIDYTPQKDGKNELEAINCYRYQFNPKKHLPKMCADFRPNSTACFLLQSNESEKEEKEPK